MADQKVEMELSGKSNIDEVVKKAQSSMSTMEKSIEGINNKFRNFGKDLFLSTLGPMVIFNTILSEISASIEKAKRISEEGFKTLSSGDDQLATSRETRMARFMAMQDDADKKRTESDAGKKASTEKFFENRGFWRSAYEAPLSTFAIMGGELGIGAGAGADWIQKKALTDFEKTLTPEQLKSLQDQADMKNAPTSFKSPEGFSNVVGVGANPVMEAMSAQLEQQKRQTELLEIIAAGKASSDPIPELAPPKMISLGF